MEKLKIVRAHPYSWEFFVFSDVTVCAYWKGLIIINPAVKYVLGIKIRDL